MRYWSTQVHALCPVCEHRHPNPPTGEMRRLHTVALFHRPMTWPDAKPAALPNLFNLTPHKSE